MILPDSSAWVEYLRRTGSVVDLALNRLVDEETELAVTEPVVMEVLAGARSEDHLEELQSLLLSYRLLPLEGLADYEEAALIYRACRAAGETIRKMVDCLIAVPAIRAGVEILHNDSDFDAIARHTDLRIYGVG